MPMSTMIGSDQFFICLQCGSAFREKPLADECEAHCTQHRKCKPELKAKAAKCPG
jgi:hypothetical protein